MASGWRDLKMANLQSAYWAWQEREWAAGRDPSWIHDNPGAYQRLIAWCDRVDASRNLQEVVRSGTGTANVQMSHREEPVVGLEQAHGIGEGQALDR